VRRTTLVAVVVVATVFQCQGATAQWWDLPDGIDNPRPRYYDYHPPGVFYGDAAPVGFAASGYVAVPYAPAPAPATGGYGYGAPPYPGVVAPIAPRPLCGVYRYWRDGVCLDRRGY
jgi:hypothetical protein